MPLILRQIARLVGHCVRAPGGKVGLVFLAFIIVLNLGGVYLSVRMIRWSAAFYDALEKRDSAEAVRQIGIFAVLVGLGSAQFLVASYLRKLLQIRWRRGLTQLALDRWLGNRTYLRLRGEGLDNPDQRIADDCRIFIDKLAIEGLDLFTSLVGLTSYVVLLWSLSTFPLAFTLFGIGIEIPRYMVWAAPIYVLISSFITHGLGKPLTRLVVEQQRREADFRFALARLRQEAEPVAFSSGEPAERRILDHRFGGIIENWRKLINRELLLGCFSRPYFATVLRIPTFFALPAYLAGHVTLGGLMQVGGAFTNVVTTLSWFIFSYHDLVELGAATRRLDGFLEAARPDTAPASPIAGSAGQTSELKVRGLDLETPEGRPLVRLPDLTVRPGEAVWIRGASGIGKTTLFRALAGLWHHGTGSVERPAGPIVFTPQRAYFPLDDLRTALTYPQDPGRFDEATLRTALDRVGMDHHAGHLVTGTMPEALSGGEQQRLVLARVLLARPMLACLDEPTSALDPAAEALVLGNLRAALPQTAFVVVAHREPVGLGTVRQVRLEEADVAPAA